MRASTIQNIIFRSGCWPKNCRSSHFYPNTQTTVNVEVADNFKTSGTPDSYIFDYLVRYKSQLPSYVLMLCLSLLSAIPETSIAVLIGFYSDRYISGVSQYQGNTALWLLFLLVIVYALITYLRLAILRRVSYLQVGKTSLEFIVKILSLPYNFFVTRNLGELNSRIVYTYHRHPSFIIVFYIHYLISPDHFLLLLSFCLFPHF